MSKSLGNTLDVEELLDAYGADVCRWWVSALAYENDIKVDLEYFERAGESYRKVRNTLRFLLSNLADYDPDDGPSFDEVEPTSLTAWLLGEAATLRRTVLAAYESYQFRRAHVALRDFCTDTLSATYLDAMKDRLYCDRPDSPRRREAQAVMHYLTDLLTTLLAPILPHTADEAYRTLHGDEACVHLETAPEIDPPAPHTAWGEALELRNRALKRLEDSSIDNKLDAALTVPDPIGALGSLRTDLTDFFGVSRLDLSADATAVEVRSLADEPRCERSWRRDATVRQRSDGGWLSDRDADAAGVA
jgi:isoleucyl-tRNA synthetase